MGGSLVPAESRLRGRGYPSFWGRGRVTSVLVLGTLLPLPSPPPPSPVGGQSENITFPRTTFTGGKYSLVGLTELLQMSWIHGHFSVGVHEQLAPSHAQWCTDLSLDVDGRYLHIQIARKYFALSRYRVGHISGYVVTARLCIWTVVCNGESSVPKIYNREQIVD